MDYIVAIPTVKGREAEIIKCLQSIVYGDRTYQGYPILVVGQDSDTSLQSKWRETLGRENIIYLGPPNIERLIDYLEGKLRLNKEDLSVLFNLFSIGGARNALTAFSFLLSREPAVISLDDDEEVKDGFFGEHVRLLGTTRKGYEITLVTGPYENHDSYVGIETLLYVLRRKRDKDLAANAIHGITISRSDGKDRNRIYGIKGARGGNLSRCKTALLVPYISSAGEVCIRGSDEIQADINQRIYPKTINVYTPDAVVIHERTPRDLPYIIMGEILGIIVHKVIGELFRNGYLGRGGLAEENLDISSLVRYHTIEILEENKRRLFMKRYFEYPQDIEEKLQQLTCSTLRLLNEVELFKTHAILHLNNLFFGLRYWENIIGCLIETDNKTKRYILSH